MFLSRRRFSIGIRNKDLAIGGSESSPIPDRGGGYPAQASGAEEGAAQTNESVPTRIAILGGSTTAEVKSMLELFLLAQGIQPTFYESGYNRYCEDVLFENPDLWNFKPDIVFIHTTWHNVSQFPELLEAEAEVEQRVRREMARFESLWEKIHTELGALIIQNNFDLPRLRPLGNLEASESFGRVNFLLRLNAEFANYARNHSRFLINDILYLSAQVGLDAWFGKAIGTAFTWQ